jgi:hypothetical protein
VIAGHRDSFFWPLRNVQLGDDIFLDTPQGRFHYRVASLRVMKSHDVSVLEPTSNAMLTLITCYPFWVLGHAPDRFVVRAARVMDSTTAAFAMKTPVEVVSEPVVERPAAASEPVAPKARTVGDDEAVVKQAIERFRLTYNARLVRQAEAAGPLKFQTCDVITDGDRASATCDAFSQPADDLESYVWTFTLGRADGEWAIKSIASN